MKNKQLITLLLTSGLVATSAHASPLATTIATEIKANDQRSTEASFTEMLAKYKIRIAQFHAIASNANLPTAQKVKSLQSFLAYANQEIISQTGGSGYTYELLQEWNHSAMEKVKNGKALEAANDVDTDAKLILEIL
jgi:hypothetical protein